MNNIKVVTLVSIGLIAALMVVTASLVPGHDAQARSRVRVGGTHSSSTVISDNSQHASTGSGSIGNVIVNAPRNFQIGISNAGSVWTG